MAQTRRSRDPLPLNRVGGVALEAFKECIRCWPLRVTGFDYRTNRVETRTVNLGSTAIAQRNFHELIEGGHAKPEELYACAWIAGNKWVKEGYIWIPHLATFFGPEKEMWANFLDEAVALLAEQERLNPTPKITPCQVQTIAQTDTENGGIGPLFDIQTEAS